jgi:hypothetical protein
VAGELDEKYADKILARVGEFSVGREVAAIKAKLQRMNPEEDQAAYGRMFGDLIALEQRHRWLLGRAAGALSLGGRLPVPLAALPRDIGRGVAPIRDGCWGGGEISNRRDITGCTCTDCAEVKPQVRVIKLGPPEPG